MSRQGSKYQFRRSLAVIGKNGSGKSMICAYLKQKGYSVISLSDFVREQVRRLGRDLDRDALIQTANEMKSAHGHDYLARLALEKGAQLGADQVVFDSVRHLSEFQLLQSANVTCVGVDVPVDIRYQRILARQSETDHVDFDTFCEQDRRESEGQSLGQQLNEVLANCPQILQNDQDLGALYIKVDRVLAEMA